MSRDGHDVGRILVVDDEQPVRDESGQHVGELTLRLGIAAELGDLTGPDLAAMERILVCARRALPATG